MALIVAAATAARSYGLTARSLWFDEAFSWRLIGFPLEEMLARAAADVHPPLYYLLLKNWAFVFGSTLLSLRSFSVVMAGATVALAYFFVRYATYSRPAGLTAALLLAASGWQIQYAQEARMYTLGTALLLLSSWLLLKAVRRGEWFYWLAYAAAASAMIYVHYFAMFSLAAQAVFVLGYLLVHTKGRVGEILSWRQTWQAVVAALLIVILYLPWLPVFLSQNSQVQEDYWIPALGGWSVPDTFYRMYLPTASIPAHSGWGWWTLAVLPLAATVLGWAWLAGRTRREADWLVVLGGAVPLVLAISLSLAGQSLYQDRFFIFAHVFVVIGLAVLLSRLRPAWLKLAAVMSAALLFGAASYSFWLELNVAGSPGARAAAEYVFSRRQAPPPVVVNSPFVFFAIDYYAREQFNADPPRLFSAAGELSHFAGGPILTEEDIVGPEIYQAAAGDLWVVDTTGFGATRLNPPAPWQPVSSRVFPEVFSYQGKVLVTRYSR